ncbi:MAG: GGDEF domain-containing protein [Deltaproteobacteria bacterium]|nr:GGDEF domain-containing protein [Deltaproteobacteria bacterium]
MKHLLKETMKKIPLLSGIFLGFARRLDYKTLSRYMLKINEQKQLSAILKEASRCLKDILNYNLFAFALQDEDKLEVWIDPKVYKQAVRKVIEQDFNVKGFSNFHPIYDDTGPHVRTVTFHSTDLISYVMMDGKYFAKLYLLPDRKLFIYHNEIINIIVKSLGISLTNYMNIKRLENAAAFDPMTNCYNRREFERLIEHSIANANRYGRDLSVIMFDLDHFKGVNDKYGHLVGDTVLKNICQAIHSKIRRGDYLARYGGEEFVIVLPDTKRPRAMELAERLKQVIENLTTETRDGKTIKITASFGVAALKRNSDKIRLLKEADNMLYKAKAGGRNMVMPQMRLLNTQS